MQNNGYNAYQTQMGFMNGDINQRLSNILQVANSGGDPNVLMNQLIEKNPQVTTALKQLDNMRGGKPMGEFVLQLAKQNGISEQNLQGLMQLFGIKR